MQTIHEPILLLPSRLLSRWRCLFPPFAQLSHTGLAPHAAGVPGVLGGGVRVASLADRVNSVQTGMKVTLVEPNEQPLARNLITPLPGSQRPWLQPSDWLLLRCSGCRAVHRGASRVGRARGHAESAAHLRVQLHVPSESLPRAQRAVRQLRPVPLRP